MNLVLYTTSLIRRARLLFTLLGLGVLISCAAFTLPLLDPSEARFSNVAHRMNDTGNYVTPEIYSDPSGWRPYWAKPPLFMWLVGSSQYFLGNSQFASRLLSILALLASALITVTVARRLLGSGVDRLLPILLVSLPGAYFLGSGATTDPLLMSLTTLVMGGFIIIAAAPPEEAIARALWRYAPFIGIGLGLLVKGPLVLAMTGLPVFLWLAWTRRWSVLSRFPWISGTVLALLLAGPWYLLAERSTPGFLEYFFLVENFQRYYKPGVDVLYGSTHHRPPGTIWLLLFAATIPWVFWILPEICRRGRRVFESLAIPQEIGVFLALWTLAPGIFFTFAKQILPTYVLPGLPPFALMLALMARATGVEKKILFAAWLLVGGYATSSVILANQLERYISIDHALRAICDEHPDRSPRIATLSRVSQGALYRIHAPLCDYSIALGLDPASPTSERFDIFLVQSRDHRKWPEVIRTHYRVIRDFGMWLEVQRVS